MGMYTGLRFKGIIKEEYRDDIELMLNGENRWKDCCDLDLKEYGDYSRSDFIPFGALSYMPDEWEEETNEKDQWGFTIMKDTDGFERYFNKETGLLCFQCSLKNYDSTIEMFLNKVAVKIVDKSIHIEELYEECNVSTMYSIEDNKLIQLDSGIRYQDDYCEFSLFYDEEPEKDDKNIYYEDYDFTKEKAYR